MILFFATSFCFSNSLPKREYSNAIVAILLLSQGLSNDKVVSFTESENGSLV